MAITLALQQLTNIVAGQPESEHNDIPRWLASASQQIGTLTHASHPDAALWYRDRNNHSHALLIHPDEFTTYVNSELVPTLVFLGKLSMVKPTWIDPFHVIPWPLQGPIGEFPMSTWDPTTHIEHAQTPVQCPISDACDGHPSFSNSQDMSDPLPLTDNDKPPTYRRNVGRQT